MLRQMLRPYPALDEGLITISGDDVPLDDRGATPMGLVFHELATNAAKYGGLSTPDGRIAITSSVEGADLLVSWIESGVQGALQEPERQGFGTRLVDMSIVQQLSGEIERIWNPSGLAVNLILQPKRLSHRDDALPEQG